MKVTLAICSNRGMSVEFVQCLMKLVTTKMPGADLSIAFYMESLIDRARAIAATRFLATDGDVLFFLDDDVLFNPSDIIQLINDCMEKRSIIGGPYMLKKEGNVLAVRPFDLSKEIIIGKGGSLQEMRWVSTGFMAIHRDVIEAIAKTLPTANIGREMELIPMFQPYVHQGDYLSEDWSFCQRAADLGFKIWLDSRIVLGHVGSHIFSALN